MGISSCDHDSYVVVYDTQKGINCPVCDAETELENSLDQVEELEQKVRDLEDDERVLDDEVKRLQKEVSDV